MSKREDEIKSELGVSIGTAANRLRKMIMFDMARKLDMLDCFKCGKPIETPEEFSIEHMIPWLHNDPNLFWDLDNIAFSHLKCHVAHTNRGGIYRRIIPPDGQGWCSICNEFKDKSEFRSNKTFWNGISRWCKSCEKDKRKRDGTVTYIDANDKSP